MSLHVVWLHSCVSVRKHLTKILGIAMPPSHPYSYTYAQYYPSHCIVSRDVAMCGPVLCSDSWWVWGHGMYSSINHSRFFNTKLGQDQQQRFKLKARYIFDAENEPLLKPCASHRRGNTPFPHPPPAGCKWPAYSKNSHHLTTPYL